MALSTGRLTPQRADGGENKLIPVAVANGYTLFIGALACANSQGFLVPGASATGLRAIGVVQGSALGVQAPSDRVALASSGQTGTVIANVAAGQFLMNNSATSPLTQADLYKVCYIEDDQTVCAAGNGKSLAGRFTGFETLQPTGVGCWVEIGLGVPTGL
jgi:hypothetical protein